jgi:hypothetical protein
MIKVFKLGVSFFIILIIQLISFDEIKSKCFEKSTNLNRMASLEPNDNQYVPVFQLITTTPSINIQSNFFEPTTTTPSINIQSNFFEPTTTTQIIVNGTMPSNQVTGSPRPLLTTTYKLKPCKKFNFYESLYLKPSLLQHSNKLQELVLSPIKKTLLRCACASICSSFSTPCDYLTLNQVNSSCVLYKLIGVNSTNIERGTSFMQDGQIISAIQQNWFNQTLNS